jgi:hypothetical protein
MKPIVRVPLVLLVTAAAISLGLVGVYASTECVRFVQQKVRHHKVSAATAARWAAWDKAHPNWHPKTPKETLAQVDFACSVPLIQKPVDGDLPPLELTAFDFPVDMLPPPEAPPVTVAMNTPPQDLFPDQPTPSVISPPIYSPEYPSLFGSFPAPPTRSVAPPAPGPTPEPSSWMLLATSLLAIGTLASRRPQVAKVIARRRI